MSAQHYCIIAMGFVAVWGAYMMVRERRLRNASLGERPSLSEDQIYDEFYASSGLPRELVVRAWKETAGTLHIDAGKLRPSDEVKQLAAGGLQLQSDIDDLDVWLRVLSRKSRQNPDRLETIDDVVRFAALCFGQRI